MPRSRRARLAGIVAAVGLVAGGLGLLPGGAPTAGAGPTGYVTLPDGVKLAVGVHFPEGYDAGAATTYPTIFEMSGYDGGSADSRTLAKDFGMPGLPHDDSRQLTRMFTDRGYVVVHASVRGTGCSGGEFDLFSTQSAQDGKWIIDQWIAEQPWSNGDVAIMGHSYSGITGFMVAEQQPEHLRAMTVSGLIDDIYRGIVYPGGVANYGFPLLWHGFYRPFSEHGGGTLEGIVDEGDRQTCIANQATKSRPVVNDALVQGLVDTDNDWYRGRSLITDVDKIDVPIHAMGAYQDEQTGPRGFTHLWEQVAGVPKRLVIMNGDHNVQNPCCSSTAVRNERGDWIDHWLDRVDHTDRYGSLEDDKAEVRALFEQTRAGTGALHHQYELTSPTFPLADTTWTPWYLQPGGGLAPLLPPAAGASTPYLSGGGRQSWSYEGSNTAGAPLTTADAPDQAVFRSAPVGESTVVAGPLRANLFMTTTAPDTEVFVQVIDEAPDGSHTFLQRGMLRASHRAIDESRSDYAEPGHVLYRPYRPHTGVDLLTPGTVYELVVEVFPVGHVFHAGHRIVVRLSAPPRLDGLYAYIPKTAPSLNTILHDAAHPSSITLPLIAFDRLTAAADEPLALGCGQQEAVRCVADPGL